MLDNLSNKDSQLLTEEDIIEMMSILYNELEKEIPWQNINGDEKATILKVLYKYVENSNERLLIAMARIILAVSNIFHIFRTIISVQVFMNKFNILVTSHRKQSLWSVQINF